MLPASSTKKLHLPNGFTLVELIIVIVLLGIIATVSSKFFTNTIIGYNDADLRIELSHIGRIATEKVNRELRNAMPQSIRVSNNCLEFIPIISSAHYQDQALTYTSPTVASMQLPVSGQSLAGNQVDVFNLNFTPQAGSNYYIVVYPIGPGAGNGDPYAATNPGPLVNYLSKSFVNPPANTITRLTLNSAYLFLRHSPQRRLFIVSQPVSYCITANWLQRHGNYGFNALQGTPPAGTVQRVAQDLQLIDAGNPVIPFVFTPGSLVRNAVVKLDFRIRQIDHLGNENWIRMNHEVQMRNVP
ncbi:MAG: prepilin-type N-terminal cleavage/methylation domain-containing protein [Gammaproteobacteria bacterium]